jgi:hypothetical protein
MEWYWTTLFMPISRMLENKPESSSFSFTNITDDTGIVFVIISVIYGIISAILSFIPYIG